ncbi:Multidrug resistance protein MdtL [Corynebacterium lowii]|uniref:Multidrug resistance protein MdtL n=1 Tax=Corynebacterium lowii TaxID=1544413 RepID=A0A0N8VZU1_9CORY|nr:Multidrug resistance protein MdtL [Corynebacterium lowii]MDP9851746.1 DHA1 family bicyclomycin/chloramphenicol resistance-like MFS transporter [Corynebacterium lowii]
MPQRTWVLLLIVMAPQLGLSLVNPANSTIAEQLGVPLSQVEATLTVYMAGYALSMFLSGILADRYDARRLQSLGLGLFAAGGLLCALAPSLGWLAAGRFLQALGGTSATVLCRIIVQRRYPADTRVGVLASMSMVISLTPALSPLVGGLLSQVAPWRVLFLCTSAFALLLIPAIEFLLGPAAPENPGLPTRRAFTQALLGAIKNRDFRWYACCICLVWMTYFGFIHSSSTMLQHLLGQSALAYGALMALPALGYLAGSLMVKRAGKRSGMSNAALNKAVTRAFIIGSLGLVLTGALAATLALTGTGTSTSAAATSTATTGLASATSLALVACLAIAFVGVGAAIPYAQAGLLGLSLPYPGLVTGFFFFLQMASGALYGVLLSALGLTSVPARRPPSSPRRCSSRWPTRGVGLPTASISGPVRPRRRDRPRPAPGSGWRVGQRVPGPRWFQSGAPGWLPWPACHAGKGP